MSLGSLLFKPKIFLKVTQVEKKNLGEIRNLGPADLKNFKLEIRYSNAGNGFTQTVNEFYKEGDQWRKNAAFPVTYLAKGDKYFFTTIPESVDGQKLELSVHGHFGPLGREFFTYTYQYLPS